MPFIHHHTKSDGRNLWLFSQQEREYIFTNDLPPLAQAATPEKRWHPLREEYVFFNPGRNNRTLNPPPEYNPLAPVQIDGFPGEIPVTDFEIAVFDNRWPSLSMPVEDLEDGHTRSVGKCEVVVYSTQDHGSLADFSKDHLVMLLDVWSERYEDLISNPNISFVMPFENRGQGVGVTLPHPHGQIYAFEDTPRVIQRQCDGNQKSKYFEGLLANPDPKFVVAENDNALVYCPEFGRYPFETWVLPRELVSSPKYLSKAQKQDFAALLKEHVARLDKLFGEPMDYVMWVSFPPKEFKDSWPFHIQFWPMKRGAGKVKQLASVEQITQLFMCDILPEAAAQSLREVVL
ncbi:MAG: galactose-1-phosphate uridylyltransferase [Alphaproteobacteria bacterium]